MRYRLLGHHGVVKVGMGLYLSRALGVGTHGRMQRGFDISILYHSDLYSRLISN